MRRMKTGANITAAETAVLSCRKAASRGSLIQMEYVFTTNALCKSYGKYKALNNLTLHVPKGAIYGLVGRNGAGKTTLIRILCGLQLPTSGEYTLYGVRSTNGDIAKARRRIGAVVETPSIYLDLSARDNLKQQFDIIGMPSYEGIDELLELVGLSGTGKKRAKNFSLGMRQRLGIAIALAGNPDFLILDEPVNGLDPQGIIEVRELILKLNRERGITVLISSHILDELSRLATHYCFIDGGRAIREVSAQELEAACRKCLRVKVTSAATLASLLDSMGVEYEVVSDSEVDIYGKVVLSKLSGELTKRGCELITASERDESLEGYFMNLVGSDKTRAK